MGKPSKGTPADKRLKANKTAAGGSKGSAGATSKPGVLRFGSPAWRAKYGK